MTENVIGRMKQNLAILGLRNTHENIDEYLGNAIKNKYSTYFISYHQLIQNLLKANHENRLDERLKQYAKYKVLIIDEIAILYR